MTSDTASSATALLEAVEKVARIAGDTAMQFYRRGVSVERKSDGSEVSEADRAAERAAREWIAAKFPGDGIVGEELGESNSGAKRRWILDPIDGTASFVRRVPLWGTLIAIAEGDTVLAGAIYCAAAGELVCAANGEGCWWNGTRARVSTVARLDRATVLSSSTLGNSEASSQWNSLARRAAVARTWGDCYGYLLVATGRAEVMADPAMKDWDSAALMPVIQEAGGVFTDWRGRATGFGGSAIATNSALAAECRSVIVVAE